MGTIRQSSMKVFVTLCALVAAASSAPRYVILPIEDVDLSVFNGQYLPVVRVPGLARQARQVLEEDEFTNTQGLDFRPRQSQRREGDDSQTSASEPAMVLLMLLLQDTLDPTMLTMEHTLEDTEPSDGTLTTLSSWDLEVMDINLNQSKNSIYHCDH